MHARHAGSFAQLITSSLQLSSMQSRVSGLESFPIPVTRATGETYLRWCWEKTESHAGNERALPFLWRMTAPSEKLTARFTPREE